MKAKILFLLCLILMFAIQGYGFFKQDKFDLEKIIQSRPSKSQYIFDYANLLKYSREGREKHFSFFKEKYGIEFIFVTIPTLGGREMTDVAQHMFTNWDIGRDNNGKGVLLLLSKDEKLVKIEVGYGTEGIFTDLFCGYIERIQLKNYLEMNEVDFGFSATMEEFIIRAEGKLTDEEIKEKIKLAETYLSGGGGIKKEVEIGKGFSRGEEIAEREKIYFSAQPTPGATFKRYVESFKRCVDGAQLKFNTEEGIVFQSYYPPLSKGLCERNYELLSNAYEIKTRGDYAVVLFVRNRKAGPVFLKRTFDGWKIDYISMRKWVKYTFNNDWYICGTDHPYMFAFEDNWYSKHVWDYDHFDNYEKASFIDNNYEYYISLLRQQLKQYPDDFETIIVLTEVFFDLTLEKEAVPLLERAIQLNPRDPRAYKYLGLINRDYFNSKDAALQYFKKYVELAPEDPQGYRDIATTYWQAGGRNCLDSPLNGIAADYRKAAEYMKKFVEISEKKLYGYKWIGYFYYLAKDNSQAEEWFKKILVLDPVNEYAKDMLREIEHEKP